MAKHTQLIIFHIVTTLIFIVCACILNWHVWTYIPDAQFETLQTKFYPFYRVLVTLWTIAVAIGITFNKLTLRVIRKLTYEASCKK